MGLTRYIKKYIDGQKIEYRCSNCDKLMAIIHEPYSCSIELQISNNICPNCSESISQISIISIPIIDATILE